MVCWVDVGAGSVTVCVSVSVTVCEGVVTVFAGAVTVVVLVTVVEDWVGKAGWWSRLFGWRSWADAAGAGSVMTWSTLCGWPPPASTPTSIPTTRQVIAPATRAAIWLARVHLKPAMRWRCPLGRLVMHSLPLIIPNRRQLRRSGTHADSSPAREEQRLTGAAVWTARRAVSQTDARGPLIDSGPRFVAMCERVSCHC